MEAVFFRRAIHDQVSRDFPHAIEIANFTLQIAESLSVDLVGIDLSVDLRRRYGAREWDNVAHGRPPGASSSPAIFRSPAERVCRNAATHGRSPILSGRYMFWHAPSCSLNCAARYRA